MPTTFHQEGQCKQFLRLFCFLILQLHGTYRKKNRIYNEDIFYGKGKALNEVSQEVLLKDLAERKSENPHAYREKVNINELTDRDVKELS